MNNRRLLVIEDEQEVSRLVRHVAEDAGFTTHTAAGPNAIGAATSNFKPDVIVLDILMPDMDGIETLQFLHQQFSRARIIIMSGSDGLSRGMTERLGKALGLSVVANLQKPFRVAELKKLLTEVRRSLPESGSDLSAEGAA